MDITSQIDNYLQNLEASKRADMETLHQQILALAPDSRLWFLDGRDDTGKVVTNPNIGYGELQLNYADGSQKDFYRVGISGNSTGISVYIMGLNDKKLLADTYGGRIGKATVTGYCIKFKKLTDVHMDVLMEAIRFGLDREL